MVAEGGEGENPLPFSLTAPKRGVGGGGGGGRGGIPASFPSHLRSSRFSRHPRLRQAPTRRFAKNRHSHRLTSNFLLRLKPMGPGLKTLGCYHNPQSADLGGRWMVSEGGALQSQRGSRLRSSISAAGPGPKPLRTWPTSP